MTLVSPPLPTPSRYRYTLFSPRFALVSRFPPLSPASLEPRYLTACITPAPPVQLNGGHSALADRLQHMLKKITMTALAAGNCFHDTTAPTSATLGRVLQNITSRHGKQRGLRPSRLKHRPQIHTPLSSATWRWTLGFLRPVCKLL